MGERKRTIIVSAWDDPKEPDGIGFGLAGYGVKRDEIRCSKDNKWEKMRKNESHSVRFELANRSSINLRFPSDKRRAMWVGSAGGECPKQTAYQDEVVCVTDSSDDPHSLTVTNHNHNKGDYKFSLNFVDADAADESHLIPFDPIWNNQNGGSA